MLYSRQFIAHYCLFTLLLIALIGCSSKSTLSNTNPLLSLSEGRYGHTVANDGEKIYVFGGTTASGLSGDIEIFTPQSTSTQVLKRKLIPRRYASAVWDGEESIYIIGGVSAEDRRRHLQSAVEVFNTRTQEVTLVSSHSRATRMNTAVYANGKIYVLGGTTAHPGVRGGLKHVAWLSVFDTQTGVWSELPDMPIAFSTKAVARDGNIYIAGGFDGNQHNAFYEYATDSGQWQQLPQLPVETSAHSIAIVNSSLYTFGNYDELGQTLRYDFATSQWSDAELPFKPSRHNASTTLGDSIVVVGGCVSGRNSYLSDIQSFTL